MLAFMPWGPTLDCFLSGWLQLLALFINRDGWSSHRWVSGRTFLIYTSPSFTKDCSPHRVHRSLHSLGRGLSNRCWTPYAGVQRPCWAGDFSIGSFHLTETQILILFVTFAVLIFLLGLPHEDPHRLGHAACAQDPETTSSFG